MHPDEYANWVRIKLAFEEKGTTNNYFYTRACAIVGGQPDPMSNLPNVRLILYSSVGRAGDC